MKNIMHKYIGLIGAAVICAMLSGCSAIGEAVDSFIENDANIGKNAPAVGGTLAVIEPALQEEEDTDITGSAADEDEEYERLSASAKEIVSKMSIEEKTGQLLLARMPDDPVSAMNNYHLGGFTLYAEDFKERDAQSVKRLVDEISAEQTIYPFFAVDEEGGSVVRISRFTQYREEPFSSPQQLLQRGGTELLELETQEKAELLSSLGINLNLAPVADISDDPDSYIAPRTMGRDAEGTAEAVEAVIRIMNGENIASCIKHFPGYGDNTDTHSGTAHDARELYEFYNRDFVPFERGINADPEMTPAVMVGHTVYDMIDEGVPASLSPVVCDILRERLGFKGVIITDDMSMDALAGYSDEIYVKALLAGNDMLCVSDHEQAYSQISAAVENGAITEEQIDEKLERIIIMKLEYGIIDN